MSIRTKRNAVIAFLLAVAGLSVWFLLSQDEVPRPGPPADLVSIHMDFYTITYNPSDHPGLYCVRRGRVVCDRTTGNFSHSEIRMQELLGTR